MAAIVHDGYMLANGARLVIENCPTRFPSNLKSQLTEEIQQYNRDVLLELDFKIAKYVPVNQVSLYFNYQILRSKRLKRPSLLGTAQGQRGNLPLLLMSSHLDIGSRPVSSHRPCSWHRG